MYQFNVPPADANAVNDVDAEFWHIESGEVTVGILGVPLTTTSIVSLALSQPFIVWLT